MSGRAKISAANAVGHAITQVCGLYDVPLIRIQSRVFQVAGFGGRQRPMFIGNWTDELGIEHFAGIADYLAMPRITIESVDHFRALFPSLDIAEGSVNYFYQTVPLWIECKSGEARMGTHQKAFKRYVEQAGAYHIQARDSADSVIEWFEKYKVKRR